MPLVRMACAAYLLNITITNVSQYFTGILKRLSAVSDVLVIFLLNQDYIHFTLKS